MAEEQVKKEPGFWDYATPILTGMGAAAVTGTYNNYAVNKQNQFNAIEAERNRQYETQMSNTAYTRAYADMKNAGLNPHLAGGQGGASSPAGTAATGAQAMPLDIAGSLNAASTVALTRAQLSNIEADTNLKEKQSGKTKAERDLIDTQNTLTELQQELTKAQTKEQKAAAEQKFKAALAQQIENVYMIKYGRKMGTGGLNSVLDRVYNLAMDQGSTTGLEYLIEEEIDKTEQGNDKNKLRGRKSTHKWSPLYGHWGYLWGK